jgi:hypothetical protein
MHADGKLQASAWVAKRPFDVGACALLCMLTLQSRHQRRPVTLHARLKMRHAEDSAQRRLSSIQLFPRNAIATTQRSRVGADFYQTRINRRECETVHMPRERERERDGGGRQGLGASCRHIVSRTFIVLCERLDPRRVCQRPDLRAAIEDFSECQMRGRL